jgi:hypothetical protein
MSTVLVQSTPEDTNNSSASTPAPASLISSPNAPLSPVVGKSAGEFRDYSAANSRVLSRVEKFYHDQHIHQTYEFAGNKMEEYGQLNHFKLGTWETLEWLNSLIDASDPDTDVSQLQHALQTAEAIRKAYPQEEFDCKCNSAYEIR